MWHTQTSVRLPSFWGPFGIAMALMIVSSFSVAIWDNMYICEAVDNFNHTMKAGAWGVCVSFIGNTTGMEDTTHCTSPMSNFDFRFVLNSTGDNMIPFTSDENTLLGITDASSTDTSVEILSSAQTGLLWLHPIGAILAAVTMLSIAVRPKWLGEGKIAELQKSGILTLILYGITWILLIVIFAVDLKVALAGRDAFSAIDGIEGRWGNLQWFALPSFIVMLVPIITIAVKPSPPPPGFHPVESNVGLQERQSH